MRRALIALVFLIALSEAALIVVFIDHSQVSTIEIDRDRAAVQIEIKNAQQESAKYSGGAIKAFIEIRLATLHNTLAMLDQKRTSLLRIIALTYSIDGQATRVSNDKELNEILRDVSESERTVAAAKQEAAKYSGGLVQAMALVKAATEEVTVASLRMKFYSAKYGFPMPIPSPAAMKTSPPTSPGKVVKDREAL
jgi:hypothetical protein